ncbi:PREDICTED: amiloride-sensitive sodium channel subunit alpha-like [Acropora digitifera]|uniref:amiloride-sensitive sodium channel subunit alpha-like n=1 Tax=Acropora digitifera TaxID=70779 RepID=UPI00077AA866|nr:PREDICTED: amiloride-sensitive sodium channel subunit alpha-like [Acropora digitifera]
MELQGTLSRDSLEEDSKVSGKTLWTLIKDFCDYTSAHGFGRIKASKNWFLTIFWSMLFVGAVTIMTIQLHSLYKKYKSRPLTTLIEVETSTSLPFPTVTFCNFNPIRDESFRAMIEIGKMQNFSQLLSYGKNASINERRPRGEEVPENKNHSSGKEDDDDNDNEDGDDDDDDYEDPTKNTESFLKSENMAMVMAQQDRTTLSSIGHQFEDMVLSCTYRGISCGNMSSPIWKEYWHYKYGNCYVFNSGIKTDAGEDAPILKSNKVGPSHGLSLELNVEQDEYIGSMTPEAGIRMDISTQREMPFPMEKGISISPGYATMIGLRKEILVRKDPFDRQRCLKDLKKDESNLYTKHFGVMYSKTACKESCLAFNQRQQCGCMEYRFPGSDKIICNVSKKSTAKCLAKVQRRFKENKLNCTTSCPPPCREEIFKTSSSFAIWPSEKHKPIYTASLEKRRQPLHKKHGSHRKNVCKVQVFYEELKLEKKTEQRSYMLEDFVSDIGGQLGLWVGFSVFTVAEFLELVLLIVHAAVNICKGNRPLAWRHSKPEQAQRI